MYGKQSYKFTFQLLNSIVSVLFADFLSVLSKNNRYAQEHVFLKYTWRKCIK